MRAQIAGQVFIYIITLVVVVVILIFGYRSITSFKERTEDISALQFRQELESSIRTISGQYGTLKVKQFPLDSSYQELCFVNNYNFDMGVPQNTQFADYPLILDTFSNFRPTANTFLILKDQSIAGIYTLGNISLAGNFQCFPFNRSVVTLRIEGKGDHAVIS
ncbi:MAG: hypothetical protein Q7S65_02025 [Nanoarchaeota archaeon]|nr:hypothetical protein [Nanoarchaeota archaeon]